MEPATAERRSQAGSQVPVTGHGDSRSRRRWCELPLPRRLAFLSIYAAYLGALAFGGYKLYFKFKYNIPLSRTLTREDHVWLGQYPELWRSEVVETSVTREDEHFDVLLLGGSVFAQAQTQLQRKLHKKFGDGIRVFGLAASGHTTRDSYLKHSRLSDKEFDLIVIYHGINDVRLNCCSPGTYRDDYAHCNWYASFTNHVNSARGANATELKEIGAATTGSPSKELLDFGNVIRTPTAFRNNLKSIILHTEKQKTAVLIITFSYYIPSNYSLARMESGQLDYGPGQYDLVVESWGHPENVRTTIDAHNALIRQLCARYRWARLLDLAKSFPADGHHFSDVCHLTEAGIRRFVSRVGEKIVEIKRE